MRYHRRHMPYRRSCGRNRPYIHQRARIQRRRRRRSHRRGLRLWCSCCRTTLSRRCRADSCFWRGWRVRRRDRDSTCRCRRTCIRHHCPLSTMIWAHCAHAACRWRRMKSVRSGCCGSDRLRWNTFPTILSVRRIFRDIRRSIANKSGGRYIRELCEFSRPLSQRP